MSIFCPPPSHPACQKSIDSPWDRHTAGWANSYRHGNEEEKEVELAEASGTDWSHGRQAGWRLCQLSHRTGWGPLPAFELPKAGCGAIWKVWLKYTAQCRGKSYGGWFCQSRSGLCVPPLQFGPPHGRTALLIVAEGVICCFHTYAHRSVARRYSSLFNIRLSSSGLSAEHDRPGFPFSKLELSRKAFVAR